VRVSAFASAVIRRGKIALYRIRFCIRSMHRPMADAEHFNFRLPMANEMYMSELAAIKTNCADYNLRRKSELKDSLSKCILLANKRR